VAVAVEDEASSGGDAEEVEGAEVAVRLNH
jgi:hypothetical protein